MGLGFLSIIIGILPALSVRAENCAAGDRPMHQVELFFGTAIQSHSPVTMRVWRQFLATEVTPRFPAGLTIFEARGQWQRKGGQIVREGSHVLVVLYQVGEDAETRIDAIRAAYQKRFHQDSVLRVESEACVSF
jgi:hypothetical protein